MNSTLLAPRPPRRGLDALVAFTGIWALASALLRDAWGGLALLNAWGFWVLITGLPVGAARIWQRARPRGRARAALLTGGWLAAGVALLLDRFRWPLRLLDRHATPPAQPRAAMGAAAVEGIPLRLMSFNVLKDNRVGDHVLEEIRHEQPDIVLIQELEPAMNARLQAGLAEFGYCHWQANPRPGGGYGIFSRLPFQVTRVFDAPGTRPFGVRATFRLDGQTVDVYNIHLLPVGPGALRSIGLTANFRMREAQVDILLREIGRRGLPALALGDCNLTEGNTAYKMLSEGLTDAWLEVGRGPGWTWPRILGALLHLPGPAQPMLRLDYCFCTPEVRPTAMHVVRNQTGSDHCPIVVSTVITSLDGSGAWVGAATPAEA